MTDATECIKCGSDRIKTTPSGRRYCIPCRLGHDKRRRARRNTRLARGDKHAALATPTTPDTEGDRA